MQMKLSGHPAQILHHPNLGHGGLLLNRAWMAEVVAAVAALTARG